MYGDAYSGVPFFATVIVSDASYHLRLIRDYTGDIGLGGVEGLATHAVQVH